MVKSEYTAIKVLILSTCMYVHVLSISSHTHIYTSSSSLLVRKDVGQVSGQKA